MLSLFDLILTVSVILTIAWIVSGVVVDDAE